MSTEFSLHRIGLLLRADWIEYKRNSLFRLIAIPILLIMILAMERPPLLSPMIFWFIVPPVSYGFCSYVNKKIHAFPFLYNTLPANNIEKFSALLIEGLLLFIASILVIYITIRPSSFELFFNILAVQSFQPAGFIVSLMLLAHVAFKKYALPNFLLGLALASLPLLVFGYFFLSHPVPFSYIEYACPDLRLLGQLSDYFNSAMWVVSLLVLYITYLKLKENELK